MKIMKRVETKLDAKQVIDVISSYSSALQLLDDYDHQSLEKPIGERATYVITYEECKAVIAVCPLQKTAVFSEMRKIIPLEEALELFINHLVEKKSIRH